MRFTIVPVTLGPKSTTKLTTKQVQALEKFYKCHAKPSKTLRRELSSQLNIPIDQVDRWFKNRSVTKDISSKPSPSRTINPTPPAKTPSFTTPATATTLGSTPAPFTMSSALPSSSPKPSTSNVSISPSMGARYPPILLPRLTEISLDASVMRSDPALYSLSI